MVNNHVAAVAQVEIDHLTALGVKHIILSSHLQRIVSEGTTFDVNAFSNFLVVVPEVPLATFQVDPGELPRPRRCWTAAGPLSPKA